MKTLWSILLITLSFTAQAQYTAGNGITLIGNQISASGARALQARYALGKSGVPIILTPSGSMGNNGALTIGTALARTYARAYFWMPAGSVATSVPASAELLYGTCSSTTSCTLFNNTCSTWPCTGTPNTTSFSTTGPGAYTQSTSAQTVLTFQVPANSLGPNGSLYLRGLFSVINNSNTHVATVAFGGTNILAQTVASQNVFGIDRSVTNLGVTNAQLTFVASGSTSGTLNEVGPIGSANANATLAINTTANQNITVQLQDGTATDYLILENFNVEAEYAP